MARVGWRGLALPLVLVAALTTACNGDDDEASSTTTTDRTTTTAVTSTSASTAEQAVLDAYQGYWRTWLAANNPPDQFNADLKLYATGDAYKRAFDEIQANRVQGRALRLPDSTKYTHRAEVLEVTADSATVRDCNIDDALLVNAASGEVINATVATKLIEATMVLEDNQWKLSVSTRKERWEGVAGCAAG